MDLGYTMGTTWYRGDMVSNPIASQDAVLDAPGTLEFNGIDSFDTAHFSPSQEFREEPISNEQIELALNRLTNGLTCNGYSVSSEGRISNARYYTVIKEDDGTLSLLRTGFGDFNPGSYEPASKTTGMELLSGLGPQFVLAPRPEFLPQGYDYGLSERDPIQYLLNEASYVFVNDRVHVQAENLKGEGVIDPADYPSLLTSQVVADDVVPISRQELYARLRTRLVHERCDIKLFEELYENFPRSLEGGMEEANRLSRLANKAHFELDYHKRQELIANTPDMKLALTFEELKDFVLNNHAISIGKPEAVHSFHALLAKYDPDTQSFLP